MGIIERQKQDIQKQIILIIEAIEYLATVDNTDIQTVGAYIADTDFLATQHFLLLTSPTKIKPTKINDDGYYSCEYEPYCYHGELQTWINDFIYNSVINTKLQPLGFAKKRFLLHLQNKGFAISDDDIKNSFSPIYDDMCIGDDVAGFAFYEALPKDYNILLQENKELRAEIEQLKNKQLNPNSPQYGYLDSNNKYFAIEMKIAHEVWNNLYLKDNHSPLPHGRQVKNYLKEKYKATDKAIGRITTITNPKDKLSS